LRKAKKNLGWISDDQIAEMEAHLADIDFAQPKKGRRLSVMMLWRIFMHTGCLSQGGTHYSSGRDKLLRDG
jgi:hypothetical protein